MLSNSSGGGPGPDPTALARRALGMFEEMPHPKQSSVSSTGQRFYHAHSTLLTNKVVLIQWKSFSPAVDSGLVDWIDTLQLVQCSLNEATHQQYRQRTILSAPSKAK